MISVIIPAYQCADTIENTVNSILVSGLSDFDIIIIDDGSQDATAEICDRLAEKHSCIRCLHQKNAGVSSARNRGLKEATGEYVWFFDADDSVDPDALTEIEPILKENAPDLVVFGMSFDYYHKGKRFRRDEMLPPQEGVTHTEECECSMYRLYASNALSSLCNRIIKRRLLVREGLMLREDLFLYEDLEFSLRVWKHCDCVCFVRQAIYRYRQAEDGGNAGRRLMRVPHIPVLLSSIENALDGDEDGDKILLALYLTLAREKIGTASRTAIRTVCADFRNWIDERGLLPSIEHRKYPMMIYHGETSRLIAKRSYSHLRHRTADWVKQNFGDFRK